MIWHIFKKDARLLGSMAALVAALHVCAAIPRHLLEHQMALGRLGILSDLLSALALLGVTVLAVVVMQQDAVPGTRQDWLIRPIRRRDLILAKVLFVLLLVQLPLWIADLGITLADGFSLPAAAAAAATRNLQIFCEFSLPSMMIGVITSSFVEAFVVWTIGAVIYMSFFLVFLSMLLGIKGTVGETGAAWMFTAAFDVLALGGAGVILTLQYFERRTALARWLVGVGGALVIGVGFMPWRLAFSMQTALSPQPAAAQAVAIAFDPHAGRFQLPPGAAPAVASALHLPLSVSNVPADSSVVMDRADVRITALDGTTLFRGKTTISVDGRGSWFDAYFEVRAGHGDAPVHSLYQSIFLPEDVFVRLKDRPVRMAIDYSLTLFTLAHHYLLPAIGASAALPGYARCATGIDAEGDDVVLRCRSAERQPTCISGYLEYQAAGQTVALRNPEIHMCYPDYSPPPIGNFWPDAINRTSSEFSFFDRSGLVRYPVDGSKLSAARLVITTYEARDHFTRHVDTPVVRLADLAGLAGEPP
jgi:hypothetical protein